MRNLSGLIELLLAGAALVPINTIFRPRELRRLITDSEIRVLFTADAFDQRVNCTTLLYEALPGLAAAVDSAQLDLPSAPELPSR